MDLPRRYFELHLWLILLEAIHFNFRDSWLRIRGDEWNLNSNQYLVSLLALRENIAYFSDWIQFPLPLQRKEEHSVHGSDEEVDDPPEMDSDEDYSDDDQRVHEEVGFRIFIEYFSTLCQNLEFLT